MPISWTAGISLLVCAWVAILTGSNAGTESPLELRSDDAGVEPAGVSIFADRKAESPTFGIHWRGIEAPALLAVAFEFQAAGVENERSQPRPERALRGTVVIRSIDSRGSDSIRLDPRHLHDEFLHAPLRITAWVVPRLRLERLQGSLFVRGGLRPDGEITLEPAGMADRFVFLRDSDRGPYLPDSFAIEENATEGNQESLNYRVTPPLAAVLATSTLALKVWADLWESPH